MVSAKEFAAQGSKYLGRSYSEMDCQAFVEKCLADVGIKKDWRGSNAMARDMAWIGTPEECKAKFGRIPVGAFLYIHYPSGEPDMYKADRMGDFGHVGIVLGSGDQGAIHSSKSRGGVYYSKFNGKTIPNGGWNRVGLCKLLDYGLDATETEGNAMAYVIKDKTVTATPNATVTAANGQPVNFRKLPMAYSSTWGALPVGTRVEVYGTVGEYYKVRHAEHEGFIACSFVKKDNPTKPTVNTYIPETQQEAPQTAQEAVDSETLTALQEKVDKLTEDLQSLTERMERMEREWGNKMGWG